MFRQRKKLGLDFVLITGDIAHDGSEEDYRALRRALDEKLDNIPWFALPGNHDSRDAFCRGLFGINPQPVLDAVYEVNGLRIITMDSGSGITGIIHGRQIEWLRGILSVPSQEGTLLALHHPLIPNQEGLGSAQYDPKLLEVIAHSDIMGVFCGHTHRNYIGILAGKQYFTSDSMSYAFETHENRTSIESRAAYSQVSLYDGILAAQVRQLVPSPEVTSCFPTDTISELFTKRK